MDRFLHGNGTTCPACDGEGFIIAQVGLFAEGQVRCKPCKGTGRRIRPVEDVVADHCAGRM